MSAHAVDSDWAQLEAGTFRFRDPLNQERRFIPMRLDDAPIKGSLAQFLYIDWTLPNCDQEYAKLLDSCRSSAKWPEETYQEFTEKVIQLDYEGATIHDYERSGENCHCLS